MRNKVPICHFKVPICHLTVPICHFKRRILFVFSVLQGMNYSYLLNKIENGRFDLWITSNFYTIDEITALKLDRMSKTTGREIC